MSTYLPHQSVLAKECLHVLGQSALDDLSEYWMIDCTFGAGGHSLLFLEHHPKLKIIATEQDADALANAKAMIKEKSLQERIILLAGNFNNLYDELKSKLENKKVMMLLADIGVSSHHLDDAKRGFSFRSEGPLDMRMDQSGDVTAATLVNELSETELERIFKEYGEEPFSRKIAREIVLKRKMNPILQTKQLEEICFLSYPPALRHKGKHPALRVFQALRIVVNRELEVLKEALPKWFDLLSDKGRMGVISFHSLEDRIVKHTFLHWSKELWSGRCKILTKKPIIPGQQEINYNPRARSAKLRVLEKCNP